MAIATGFTNTEKLKEEITSSLEMESSNEECVSFQRSMVVC